MSITLPGPLVSADWLAAVVDDDELCILDATKYLPNEALDGAGEFARAHIQGARFFDIDMFADPDTDLPHMVPTAGRFARLAGATGIGDGTCVVVYDQKGQSSAARAWWLLRLFGHDRVALLDGGLPAWRAGGHPVQAGPAAPATPRRFTPRLRTSLLAGLGDVAAGIVPDSPAPILLLDARPAARFAGTAPEPRPGLASGHIPGACSVPAGSVLDADQRFLPPDALRKLFVHAGVDGSRRIVTTCGTGVTAATLAFALALAGLPDAAIYDGSWAEWGSLPETPKQVSL